MSNDQVNLDTQAIRARAKLRSATMRAVVRDISEAADGLDVWCQLSDKLATKQRETDATIARCNERAGLADADASKAEADSAARVQAANKRRDDADAEAAEAATRRDQAKADAANEELRLAAARAAHAEFRQKVGV